LIFNKEGRKIKVLFGKIITHALLGKNKNVYLGEIFKKIISPIHSIHMENETESIAKSNILAGAGWKNKNRTSLKSICGMNGRSSSKMVVSEWGQRKENENLARQRKKWNRGRGESHIEKRVKFV
jgi:hypothetical protein